MANQMVSKGENIQNCLVGGATSSGSTHERSFVRTIHQNKRRSLAFQSAMPMQHDSVHQQQMRTKPAIEIYRPPSNAQSVPY